VADDKANCSCSWRWVVAIFLAALGLGLGVRLMGPKGGQEGPIDNGYAFEDRWAAVLRDGGGHGASCPKGGGQAVTVQMGLTADGRPWMGAASPVLEIQEFTDYRCPDCRKGHLKVRRLLSLFPGQVRIVYRHLPMDPACNPDVTGPIHDRACELARIAVCASRQGRFWEAHDYLLANAEVVCAAKRCAAAVARALDLDEDAFMCCMDDPGVAELLARDIAEAKNLGIRVTPTFFVGGRLYEKAIPDEALAPLLASQEGKE